ncbi:hypothetical protein Cni_G06077 [Canna indica]|uniref:Uncharacterized protein n=1 Tax=Canna indica TaxID=4628 RepID=A0AAQ3JVV2_9LILI|nr:hypothetical protein Cni_G06077 [Canna indica]
MPVCIGILGTCRIQIGYYVQPQEKLGKGAWIKEADEVEKEIGEKLIAFIANSFWLLWKNRCQMKFKRKKEGLNCIFVKAFNDALEYCRTGKKPNCKGKDVKNEMHLNYWESSLFCDAAWKDGISGGVGFVLTEHEK